MSTQLSVYFKDGLSVYVEAFVVLIMWPLMVSIMWRDKKDRPQIA
jgi:hypothetical protein